MDFKVPAAAPLDIPAGERGADYLRQRTYICDTLYRYSSSADALDCAAVRDTFTDDAWAQYGNLPAIGGGDAIVAWIAEVTDQMLWQHHHLTVYHVDIRGGEADTISYLRSYQVYSAEPDVAKIIVARYFDTLRLTERGWKISKRVMEFLWAESQKEDGFMAQIGGRGPGIWERR